MPSSAGAGAGALPSACGPPLPCPAVLDAGPTVPPPSAQGLLVFSRIGVYIRLPGVDVDAFSEARGGRGRLPGCTALLCSGLVWSGCSTRQVASHPALPRQANWGMLPLSLHAAEAPDAVLAAAAAACCQPNPPGAQTGAWPSDCSPAIHPLRCRQ